MNEHECTQEDNISKLFDFHEDKMKKLQEMEVRQVEIQGDVKHIKTRIDNGMSHTIHNLDQTLAKLEPIIAHHTKIITKIENIGWTLSTTILIAVIALIGWAIAHGFKLPV